MTYGRTVELSLQSIDIPFLSTDAPRTAVLQEIGQQAAGGKLATNVSPQILYAQNVLPTKWGYASLIKKQIIPETALVQFKHVQPVIGPDTKQYALASTADGAAASLAGSDTWTYQTPIVGITAETEFSVARVDGEVYFLYEGFGAYKLETGPISFSSVTLTGLTAATLRAICGASGYVIVADADTLYWDSPGTRLNFTPVLGGAGSTKVSYLNGEIIAMYPISNGFIIYSSENAVSAKYSGNPNFPFVFQEIPGSGGISYGYNVSFATNRSYHIAWTTNGLQQISASSAENMLPEFTEFAIKGKRQIFAQGPALTVPLLLDGSFSLDGSQVFNGLQANQIVQPPTYDVETINYGLGFIVRPALVNNRYIVLSYGPPPQNLLTDFPVYLEAAIYDLDLQLWGKIVRKHVSFLSLSAEEGTEFYTYNSLYANNFTYDDLASTTYLNLVQDFGFNSGGLSQFTSVNAGGEMVTYSKVQLDANNEVDTDLIPTVLFGRLAIFKQRPTQIHQFEFNEVDLDDPNAALLFWSSMKSSSKESFADPIMKIPYLTPGQGTSPKIKLRKTALQFGFGIVGNFELTTIIVRCQEAGSR